MIKTSQSTHFVLSGSHGLFLNLQSISLAFGAKGAAKLESNARLHLNLGRWFMSLHKNPNGSTAETA